MNQKQQQQVLKQEDKNLYSVKRVNNTENLPNQFQNARIIVGVAGGSASGKTTICSNIKKELRLNSDFSVTIISLDSFYKTMDKTKHDPADYDFDHPDALDFDYAYEILLTLLKGEQAQVPEYDFVTHSRLDQYDIVSPGDVIFFQGILALYDEKIRNLMNYKIFMHCDDDIRLCRRMIRDIQQRGRDVKSVLMQYNRFVKPAFDKFIKPSMNFADLIVPGSRNNRVSVNFIVQHLQSQAKHLRIFKETLMMQTAFLDQSIPSLEAYISFNEIAKEDDILKIENNSTFLIMPPDDFSKRTVRSYFSAIHEKNFKGSEWFKTIVKLLKVCGDQLFLYLSDNQKFKFQDLLFIDLAKIYQYNKDEIDQNSVLDDYNVADSILENIKEYQKEETIQNYQYIVIAVPIMFEIIQLEKVVGLIQEKSQSCKIVLLMAISPVDALVSSKLRTCCEHFVTSIVLANQEKYKQMILENIRDASSLIDPTHDSQQYISKIEKSIKKKFHQGSDEDLEQ